MSKLYFIHILSALHNQMHSKVIEAWVHLSEEPNISKIVLIDTSIKDKFNLQQNGKKKYIDILRAPKLDIGL